MYFLPYYLVIVAHDTFMSTVSTVVDMEEYVDRMKVRTLNGNPMENWWILDFTTEELSKIGIKQIRGTMRATMYDGLYKYPTLKQVLQLVSEFNTKTKGQRNPNKSLVGILLEIKDYGVASALSVVPHIVHRKGYRRTNSV